MKNETRASLGVVTACHRGDYFMAKATCASIRHFLPDAPICVVVDGDFSIAELERVYGVIPLYLHNLKDQRLRVLCPGSGKSKLAALWEGPFDKFLYLDSDALVWGNILSRLEQETADFIVFANQQAFSHEQQAVSHYFFDVDLLKQVQPEFRWEARPYFCTGAFVAGRNAVGIEHYLGIEKVAEKHPQLFKFWEQGMLNFSVFNESDHGRLRYSVEDLQYIPVDHSRKSSEARFQCRLLEPPVEVDAPTVIHFCGRKPLLQNWNAYSRPFTAFRLQHYRRLFGDSPLGTARAWMRIFSEEVTVLKPRLRRKLARLGTALMVKVTA